MANKKLMLNREFMQTREELLKDGYRFVFAEGNGVIWSTELYPVRAEVGGGSGKTGLLIEGARRGEPRIVDLLTSDFKLTKKGRLKETKLKGDDAIVAELIGYYLDAIIRASNRDCILHFDDGGIFSGLNGGLKYLCEFTRDHIRYDGSCVLWDIPKYGYIIMLYNMVDWNYSLDLQGNLDAATYRPPFRVYQEIDL